MINKYFVFTGLFIFIFILGIPNESFALDKFHSYEKYKTVYKLSGLKSGEKIFCSKNWGNEKVQIERVSVQVSENEKKVINQKVVTKIIDGEQWIYSINLDNNTGNKAKNTAFPKLRESIKGKDPTEFGKYFLKELGGKIIGEKTILGNKCEIWKVATIETCVSEKGVALETKSSSPNLYEVATSFETGLTCSEQDFSLGDINFKLIDVSKPSN